MNKYCINSETLAILPYEKRKSIVYEGDKNFIVEASPMSIIKYNCYYSGIDYNHSVNNSEKLTGYTYKTPLYLNIKDTIIIFPTNSPRLNSCGWVCLNNIDKTFIENRYSTSVLFNNGISIILPVTYNIINNQINRSCRLENILRKNGLLTK